MALNKYIINFVNANKGTIEINPSLIDGPGNTGGKRSTDIDLLGSGHIFWGEKILENLVHILENFSSPEDPGNLGFPLVVSEFAAITPTRGQLWYNETSKKLLVYDDNGSPVSWNSLAGLVVSITPPTNPLEGDFWWDTTSFNPSDPEFGRNLKIYISGVWVRVVEDYLPRDGSKPMGADLDMGSSLIINLANPTNPNDAVNLGFADNNYVNVTGDTMTGILNMGSNKIENVADPDTDDDAINRGYADTNYANVAGDTMSGSLILRPNIGVGSPVDILEAASIEYVDNKSNVPIVYDIAVFIAGQPFDTETILRYVAPRSLLLDPLNALYVDSVAQVEIASTATVNMTIIAGGVDVGDVDFPAGATAGTITWNVTPFTLIKDGILEISQPSVTPSNMKNLTITLAFLEA